MSDTGTTEPKPIGIFNNTSDVITIYTIALVPGYNYTTAIFPSANSGQRCNIYLPLTKMMMQYPYVNISQTPFDLNGSISRSNYAWFGAYQCQKPGETSYSKYGSGIIVYGINGKIYPSKLFLFNNSDQILIIFDKDYKLTNYSTNPFQSINDTGIKIFTGSNNNLSLAQCSIDGPAKITEACGCSNYPDSSTPYTGWCPTPNDPYLNILFNNNSPVIYLPQALEGPGGSTSAPSTAYQSSSSTSASPQTITADDGTIITI